MRLAVLKETRSAENRVALVPLGVKALVKRGLAVVVQAGAGESSGISDVMYKEAGAEIAGNAQETLKDAQVILVAIWKTAQYWWAFLTHCRTEI